MRPAIPFALVLHKSAKLVFPFLQRKTLFVSPFAPTVWRIAEVLTRKLPKQISFIIVFEAASMALHSSLLVAGRIPLFSDWQSIRELIEHLFVFIDVFG